MASARTVPRVYVSVEGRGEQLTINGPLSLLSDLIIAMRAGDGHATRTSEPVKEGRDDALTD